MALRWPDFNFEVFTVLVERSIDRGTIGDVKTEYSNDELPVDPDLAAMLLEWREQRPLRGETDWLFANPATGRPYSPEEIQKTYIRRAALEIGLGPGIGWRTFRHT